MIFRTSTPYLPGFDTPCGDGVVSIHTAAAETIRLLLVARTHPYQSSTYCSVAFVRSQQQSIAWRTGILEIIFWLARIVKSA